MSINSGELMDLVAQQLLGKTGAGRNVFLPRDWPTEDEEMPVILVGPPPDRPLERKDNAGGRTGGPQFNVSATISITGRLTGLAKPADRGAGALLAALGVLQRQIERAVIDSYAIRRLVQQYLSVDVQMAVKSEAARYVGEVRLDLTVEFYQAQEDFAPIETSPFEQLALYADLVNVFSPTGAFTDTPFSAAATPAPRDAGPDGRAEGVVIIDLPQ